MRTPTDWVRFDASIPAAIHAVAASFERCTLIEHATLFNDPRWVEALANQEDKKALIYAAHDGDGLTGLATFLVHPSALRLAFGEMTFFSLPVCRLNAFSMPVVDSNGDREREITMLTDLLSRLRADVERNEVIFLESVAQGTAMFDLVSRSGTEVEGFQVLPYGNFYRHRFAAIGNGFDGYLKQLKARTRADLKNNRKRFFAHVGGNYRTRCFRAPEEVSEFLNDAMALSRKTYQYRLLGSGLRDREMLERCYLAAANLGWFRSYVLYVNEKAIAFHVGYVYRGRFHSAVIGYDPEWARHHVGIFLLTEVLADLATSNGAVREFDFGNDDDVYKERLSTRYRLEAYFYLIPANVRGALMAHAMRTTNTGSAALGAFLGHLGVRRRVRHLLRRLGVLKQ